MKLRFLALVLIVAACMPPGAEGLPSDAPQPGDLVAGPDDDTLVEREPDLCHAADYQIYVGQPGSIVPSLGIERAFRVVEFGGIVTQEYNPGRLNFRLTPGGEIARIDCG